VTFISMFQPCRVTLREAGRNFVGDWQPGFGSGLAEAGGFESGLVPTAFVAAIT
jgi:hypothetical protein